MPKNPRVFIDVTIGSRAAGRIIFELFYDITPKTAENFRGLCTGEYQNEFQKKFKEESQRQRKLHYQGTQFHRIIDKFMIQGGDLSFAQDGSGGRSIYALEEQDLFADENFQRRHSQAGCLSMANKGPNTNGSQFFITLKECTHLDGKHVVFGQVVDGMDIVQEIAKIPTDIKDKPRIPVVIFDSGELDLSTGLVKRFQNQSIFDQNQVQNPIQQEYQNVQSVDVERISFAKQFENKFKQRKKILDQILQSEEQEITHQPIIKNNDENINQQKEKFLDIQLQINEIFQDNIQATIDEQERKEDVNYETKLQNKEYYIQKQKQKQSLQEEWGIKNPDVQQFLNPDDQGYLFESAIQAQKSGKWAKPYSKYKDKKETFGWDVFNEDSLYKAYKKRTKKIEQDLKKNPLMFEDFTEEQKKNYMAEEIEEQISKKGQFSRRRIFVEDKDIDYINERNRKFNEKLERNYSVYAADIKQNLERGTAL